MTDTKVLVIVFILGLISGFIICDIFYKNNVIIQKIESKEIEKNVIEE